ncbi:hypothetical protein SAMN04488570_2026 [Nocardioides scoriae]|uniref:Uncharacterized protein n=1 Tax=Nocardioides scoriae TaxID=642780 RepID=A0A1H1SR50_9ACTN|nr:hypothetical protein [Nocardioides scoriae]SDS50464.1 hypothetical protein SAMN04488570_2026 [Nocardioides scoriae]
MSERGGAGRSPGQSPGQASARAAARRAVIRRHHPDVGGDPEVLRRELAALEDPAPAPTLDPRVELRAPGRWQPVARVATRTRRVVRRRTRELRARLPHGWPGSRRWTDL